MIGALLHDALDTSGTYRSYRSGRSGRSGLTLAYAAKRVERRIGTYHFLAEHPQERVRAMAASQPPGRQPPAPEVG